MKKTAVRIWLFTLAFTLSAFYAEASAPNDDRMPMKYDAKEAGAPLKNGKTGETEAIMKKRLSLNGADYIAMTELGIICQDRGDRKTALNLFKKAVKTAPDYPIAHLCLGRLYFLTQENEEAVAELNLFKEKMDMLPNMDEDARKRYVDNLYYLSDVYFTLKRYKDAKRGIDRILEIDPEQQDAYYDLGVCYYVYDHSRSKAYQAFMKAVELDSTSSTAKRAKYAIEFMRNNPDPRVIPDFSFIDQEYRE